MDLEIVEAPVADVEPSPVKRTLVYPVEISVSSAGQHLAAGPPSPPPPADGDRRRRRRRDSPGPFQRRGRRVMIQCMSRCMLGSVRRSPQETLRVLFTTFMRCRQLIPPRKVRDFPGRFLCRGGNQGYPSWRPV